eukprot:CAMPEP_0175875770 /NCGR_PEP_ID=MMETSP0107_2-20121207/39644_1 /TAXON_ID=195067 ORGANISM="Goniomonas pacifica, Strain CCMP1869" /NCGR_SAMPLE_ID=MMETSP0107_2 /ASSEMBLY_ACC=CAM_ASM_000203 /LENGTH=36 /DNA_ID= /DNA_START= /DNA_END= /DNA_ORIENTATION=
MKTLVAVAGPSLAAPHTVALPTGSIQMATVVLTRSQ